MPLSVGKAAVDWLMEASGDTTDLQINFMGGEPLLCFRELLAPLVQYGHRKARSLGKAITFTATTNLTLVTQEMVDLWDRFNCGWLCSIDGTPEIQNAQRPFAGGGGSASEAERGARLILRTRPHLSVRSTIHPSHVEALAECFRHLIHLGFPLVIMALSDTHLWSGRKLTLLEEQLEKVRLEITEHLRRGCRAALSGFDYMISEILLPMREGRDLSPIPMSCGAGRGSAMIDPAGTLWPCHRFNSADRDTGATGAHSLGNLHGEFKDSLQREFLTHNHLRDAPHRCQSCKLLMACGSGCPAANLQETGELFGVHPASCEMVDIYMRQSDLLCDWMVRENSPLSQTILDELRAASRTAPPRRLVSSMDDEDAQIK